ncbi:Nucleoporin nup [Salix suchowensis]|nr:Nucleoporin nup [Salix suchowensis]
MCLQRDRSRTDGSHYEVLGESERGTRKLQRQEVSIVGKLKSRLNHERRRRMVKPASRSPNILVAQEAGKSLLECEDSLELSTSTLPKFTNQTMVLKDSELILAAGKELRIASLSESRLNKSLRKSYKVAVVVLPRSGVTRLVPEIVDCNEYDISVDTEEPQQVLTFMPERKSKSFIAQDDSERQIASFTFGRGMADWDPSRSMPSQCRETSMHSIPSAYVHALECFVAAKQEYLAQAGTDSSKSLSTMYDYQQKYIAALTKQLPLGTVFPAASRSILMHPPSTIKPRALRQGPFLLQPSPRTLEGSEGEMLRISSTYHVGLTKTNRQRTNS